MPGTQCFTEETLGRLPITALGLRSMNSTVFPVESTARYSYIHWPLTLM